MNTNHMNVAGIPVPDSYYLSSCFIKWLPRMIRIAMCLSNSPLLGRLKAWITLSPRRKEIIPLEKNWRKETAVCFCSFLNWVLAVWRRCPCGHMTHFFSPLISHRLGRRDDRGCPRWQPSLALQTVPEIHLAVIQLLPARGFRLLDETPWLVSVHLYPL